MSTVMNHAVADATVQQISRPGIEAMAKQVMRDAAEHYECARAQLPSEIPAERLSGNAREDDKPYRKDIPELVPPRIRRSTQQDTRFDGLDALMATLSKVTPEKQLAAARSALARVARQQQEQAVRGEQYQRGIDAVQVSLASLEAWRIQFEKKQDEFDRASTGSSEIDMPGGDSAGPSGSLRDELTGLAAQGWQLFQALRARQALVDDMVAAAGEDDFNLPSEHLRRDLHGIQQMLVLLGTMAKLLIDYGTQRLAFDRQLLSLQQDIRIEMIEKDADEAREAQRKARVINTVTSIVGKILGGAMVVLGVAGAIFTGGATLVFAGLGVALMLIDEIINAVTGVSFMEKLLEPIQTLLQPIFEMIVKAMAGVLEYFGVDHASAMVVGALLMAVVFGGALLVLAMTGAGGAIARGLSKLMGAMGKVLMRPLEIILSRLLPQLQRVQVRQATGMMVDRLSQILAALRRRLHVPEDLVTRQIQGHRLMQAATAATTLNINVPGVMSVMEGVHQVEFTKHVASMKWAGSELDLIGEILVKVVKEFQSSFEVSQECFIHVSNMIQQRANTGATLTQGMRNAHAV